jgi:hypothetical protein
VSEETLTKLVDDLADDFVAASREFTAPQGDKDSARTRMFEIAGILPILPERVQRELKTKVGEWLIKYG